MTKSEVIKQSYCKSKNRRVWIELHYFNEDPKPYLFRIAIKKYNGGRDIFITENWYTPESFVLLKDLLFDFIDIQLLAVVYPERGIADVFNFNIINEHIKKITK